MQYRRLGRTDLKVSAIGLGTMTWGQQNTEAEAHAQLDLAVERGINFIDAAEMYPVPPRAETQGRTEACMGSWFRARRNRDKVILATKVAGRGEMAWMRGGSVRETRLDRAQINAAIDASLKRLNTDYVDLYQTHWPDRRTNFFGQLGYSVHPDDDAVPLEDTLAALADLVKAGKVRHVGVSNETPWGVARLLRAADALALPRIVSIQNPYSLLNRCVEVGLAEFAHREEISLVAYSPLGMGMLTGKYLHGVRPAGARMTLFERFKRYSTPEGFSATERYVALAREHGLDPAQMAIAFILSRPWTTSTLIGATSLDQLTADIDAHELTLDDAVIAGIEAIHRTQPNPCP